MSWLKVDDSFLDHPKVLALPDSVIVAWLKIASWCAKYRTNGCISRENAKVLTSTKKVARLVKAGLLDELDAKGSELTVHDWSDYNPTASESLQKADENAAARKEKASRAARARWDDKQPEHAPSNAQASTEHAHDDARSNAQACSEQCSNDAQTMLKNAPVPVPHLDLEDRSKDLTPLGDEHALGSLPPASLAAPVSGIRAAPTKTETIRETAFRALAMTDAEWVWVLPELRGSIEVCFDGWRIFSGQANAPTPSTLRACRPILELLANGETPQAVRDALAKAHPKCWARGKDYHHALKGFASLGRPDAKAVEDKPTVTYAQGGL